MDCPTLPYSERNVDRRVPLYGKISRDVTTWCFLEQDGADCDCTVDARATHPDARQIIEARCPPTVIDLLLSFLFAHPAK